MYSDGAVKFYLSCDSQQQWAIREFLRIQHRNNNIADPLLSIEVYLRKREEAIKQEEKKHFKLKPEYEKYVQYTDQRLII